MTVHHWGENPVGTWYLSILDVPQKSNSDKKGLLRKWTLELHGTAEDPQPHWIPPGKNFCIFFIKTIVFSSSRQSSNL